MCCSISSLNLSLYRKVLYLAIVLNYGFKFSDLFFMIKKLSDEILKIEV